MLLCYNFGRLLILKSPYFLSHFWPCRSDPLSPSTHQLLSPMTSKKIVQHFESTYHKCCLMVNLLSLQAIIQFSFQLSEQLCSIESNSKQVLYMCSAAFAFYFPSQSINSQCDGHFQTKVSTCDCCLAFNFKSFTVIQVASVCYFSTFVLMKVLHFLNSLSVILSETYQFLDVQKKLPNLSLFCLLVQQNPFLSSEHFHTLHSSFPTTLRQWGPNPEQV